MTQEKIINLASLGGVLDLYRGFPTNRTLDSGEFPCFSLAALRNGDAARTFVSRQDIDDGEAGIAQPFDVLLSVEGGTVGESFVVRGDFSDFVPSQQVATIRVNDLEIVDPWYLGAWWSSEQGRSSLLAISQGAGIKRIPFRNLANLEVLLPSIEVQRSIGQRFRAFTESIHSHQVVIHRLQGALRADVALALAGLEQSADVEIRDAKKASAQ